jgi:hypothetical protein
LADLFAASPNLEELSIAAWVFPEPPVEAAAQSLDLASVNGFRALTHVEYHGSEYDAFDCPIGFGNFFSVLLRIPALSRLRLDSCTDYSAGEDWDVVAESSTLITLQLCHSRFSSSVLKRLVGAARALVCFECDIAEDSVIDISRGFIPFHEALSLQANSLIDIRMTIRTDEEECSWAWELPSLGPLTSFVSLRRLEISATVLLPSLSAESDGGVAAEIKDFIPASIHNLAITSLAPDTEDQLYAFIVSLPGIQKKAFPHLRHIFDLSGEWNDDAWNPSKHRDLENALELLV